MRLLIADDHELIRRGLRDLLTLQPGWQIVAEASNGAEAVSKALLTKPDVAVLDLYMPILSGLEASSQIRKGSNQTAIIILTMQDSADLRKQALEQGVFAYLSKTEADETLVDSIVAAVPQAKAGPASRRLRPQSISLEQRLTSREWEVVQLLAHGKTNREISSRLGISVRTAESHRAHINTKCGFRTIADLVRFAMSGIASPISKESRSQMQSVLLS